MRAPVPITSVQLGEAEEEQVMEVLRSGQLAQGPKVERLEELFRSVVESSHAVAVSSGTAALFTALDVLELGPGDEVITSPFTFGATLNAIIATGATARFADIGDDFNLDPDEVADSVSPRTRVIMPVHLYGLPADMGTISEIAAGNHLTIVEDAAQAIGALVDDRPVGSFGLGCFSLYATKNVTTGEGGVITTDDDQLADQLRLIRNQGMRNRYQYERSGNNFRLTDLQAALGIPQMERLADITDRRRENAAYLLEGLSGIPGLQLPVQPPGRMHVFHQFTIRVTSDAVLTRDDLQKAMASHGVESAVYYPRVVFDYESFVGHPQVEEARVPRAQSAADHVLSIPVHQHLSRQDLDMVVEAVGHSLRA